MKQELTYVGKEVYVTKSFTFSAAHKLIGNTRHNDQLHGHNYTLKVTLQGTLNEEGFLIDLDKFEQLLSTHVIYPIDHCVLNERLYPLNPTVEILALYLYNQIEMCLHICECTANLKIFEVSVYETDTFYATIRESDILS